MTGGLIGTTLHYPYEVRHARDYFGDIPDLTPAPELLRLAAHILDSKTASFAPAGFRDRYRPGCRSPSKVLPCPAGPSISSRRFVAAWARISQRRAGPRRPASGRELSEPAPTNNPGPPRSRRNSRPRKRTMTDPTARPLR